MKKNERINLLEHALKQVEMKLSKFELSEKYIETVKSFDEFAENSKFQSFKDMDDWRKLFPKSYNNFKNNNYFQQVETTTRKSAFLIALHSILKDYENEL